jgi:FKBP-type peptidyl-prolyl cis-trans isomerase FkpA
MMVGRFQRLRALGAVAALVCGMACAEAPSAPSVTPAFSQTDVRVGTGADAVNGRLLSVHYTGWLYDATATDRKGLQFETSIGGNPLEFLLGAGEVIEGWDRGVAGMRVGGVRRLVLPPSLAYGDSRNGPIPPNAALIFEIELLEVVEAQ